MYICIMNVYRIKLLDSLNLCFPVIELITIIKSILSMQEIETFYELELNFLLY